MEELIKNFDIKDMNKAAAAWNEQKLDWINGEYIRKLSDGELFKKLIEFLPKELDREKIKQLTPLIKERIKKLGNFSDVLQLCCFQLDPYLLTCYLQELATVFHKFYDQRRVVEESNPQLSAERLALIDATRIVLANGLNLLGVSAPEKM